MIEARRGSKSMPKRIAASARLAGGTARAGAAPSVAPVGGQRLFCSPAVDLPSASLDHPSGCRDLPRMLNAAMRGGSIEALAPFLNGSIEALAPFLNLASENDFVLVVAWLLGALRAGGPYPVLAIAGEQGSAKTALSKLLRALIDPSVAPVRALPRDERELFIAASHSHVLAFDNLSGLPPWLSDTFCRLTSGAAFSTRRLFTDQDEILFAAARPIILNGIEDIITRPDLADRAILLMLGAIAERQRRPEHALWREFELARPHILGALLDAAAHGLRMLPHVRLKRLPRMADFALWATACESAFRPAGTLEAAYSNNPARRD